MSINDRSTNAQFSRRMFLGAAGGSAFMWAAGEARAKAMRAGGAIDVHSHYFPPALNEVTEEALGGLTGGLPPSIQSWSPDGLVEAMDQVDIRLSVTHATWRAPMLDMDPAERRNISRSANEYGAQMRQEHPGRIDFFGFLPMPDIDGSLAEISYCLDVLKAPGITMMTSYGSQWQGDPAFEPILQELDSRGAVVLCHPHGAPCCSGLMPTYAPEEGGLLEWPYDTGRAAIGLLLSGSFAKYPNIRWIFCHSGGPLPALAGRVRTHLGPERLAAIAPRGVDYELQRQFYEIGDAAFAPSLSALLNYVPPTQILFGTDFPYVRHESELNELAARDLKPLILRAILYGNARRLMPGLSV